MKKAVKPTPKKVVAKKKAGISSKALAAAAKALAKKSPAKKVIKKPTVAGIPLSPMASAAIESVARRKAAQKAKPTPKAKSKPKYDPIPLSDEDSITEDLLKKNLSLPTRPTAALTGTDQNVFVLMGIVDETMTAFGCPKAEITEFRERANASRSYQQAREIASEYAVLV